jgi:hypothetical protein
MPRFNLVAQWESDSEEFEVDNVQINFSKENIHEVIQHMDMFLKGCGFVYEGQLGILEEEKPVDVNVNHDTMYQTPDDEMFSDYTITFANP